MGCSLGLADGVRAEAARGPTGLRGARSPDLRPTRSRQHSIPASTGSLDLVLSPLGMGASDVFVAADFALTLQRFKLPAWFFGNALPPGKNRRVVFEQELNSYDYMKVCPVQVVNRVAHIDATRRAQRLRMGAEGQAAREIGMLWDWVAQCLHLSDAAMAA